MTRRNIIPLHPSDKKMIEGEVGYLPLRAIASGTVATREPSLKKSRPFGRVSTIAARFLRHNAIALTLGFTTGVLAVLVPALVIGWVVS